MSDRFEILLEELGADRSAAEMKTIYEKRLACGHFFMPGAPELLEALYPVYDLYLASNGTTVVQQGRLKSAGISHYFREIFLSQQLGANKPDPAFFERCFEKIPGFPARNHCDRRRQPLLRYAGRHKRGHPHLLV